MKIGLYVTTLTPAGAAQARFQAGVLEGLIRQSSARHQFVVLTHEVPPGFTSTPAMQYVALRRSPTSVSLAGAVRRMCRWGAAICRNFGKPGARLAARLRRRGAYPPPPYYQQLKDLGIRLMWLVNGHELPSWLPVVRTVWDVNHRILSMYPEFSYTRNTFDNLDQPLSLHKASYLITGTEEGKHQLMSMYGVYEKKIRVIPFPTPLLPPRAVARPVALNAKADAPYVFFPARFWPHKNHVVAVEALRVLRDRWNTTVNLVFSGADEGNLEYVMSYAEKLGVRDQVIYVGKVSEEELVSLYTNALSLVFVAAAGPDNLPPLEAMSLCCPAIVTDLPGAREQFGDSALFFPTYDEAALASHIKHLLDDPAARSALIARGLNRAKQWTVEDYASRVIDIFDEFELIARAWGPSDATFT